MTHNGAVFQPFGAIVVVDLGVKRSAWPDARVGHVPWSSKCLLVNEGGGISAAAVAFASLLRPCPSILRVYSAVDTTAATVLAAVRNRQPPTAQDVSEYVYQRSGSAALALHLSDLWETKTDPGACATGPSIDRNLRRELRRFGTLAPCDWRRVAILTGTPRPASHSVARLAAEAEIDLRSLRTWTRRLLGVNARGWKELAGWEWMVEAALRRGGYIGQATDLAGLIPAELLPGAHWRSPRRTRHSGRLMLADDAALPRMDPLDLGAEDDGRGVRAG